MFPTTLRRHSLVKAPLVVNSSSAWVFIFSLAVVPPRSNQTSGVTWTHHVGRPTLHTTHRTACPQTIQGLPMFNGCLSAHLSRPWVEEQEHINSVVLRHRCLVEVTWPLSRCLPPRGDLRGSSRAGSGWVLALQQMAGTVAATQEFISAHREYRLDRRCPGSRKVVIRVSCKVSFPPTYLSRATTNEQCSAAPQSAWSTAACPEALQQTYRPRPPAPVCPRPRRPQLCVLERATRATFLRSIVTCMVCEQVSPILQPHTAALSQAAPLPLPDRPLLLASTLVTSPAILSPLS